MERLEDRVLLAGMVTQVDYFDTWAGNLILSTDPAGIAYHAPSGHLYLADSEINENLEFVGNNIFESSLAGDQLFGEIASNNDEPTGIVYSEFDNYFYVTNDNSQLITRYDINLNSPLATVKTSDDVPTATDPEGITSDPSTGFLYVADGNGGGVQILVYDPDLIFQYSFSVAAQLQDAEGIAFNSDNNHLFVVSDPDKKIVEYALNGTFVEEYDISGLTPSPLSSQGLTFAPTSDPFDDPNARALYIADGGVDNAADGGVFEVLVSGGQLTQNTAPLVNAGIDGTLVVDSFPSNVYLNAAVADDGLPVSPGSVTTTWSQVSGPAAVTFADASQVDTTVTFHVPGTYVLRLTADDGQLITSDDVTMIVRQGVEVSVAASSDDAEERTTSGQMILTSGDLDITLDAGGSSTYDQLVGLRFSGIDIPQGSIVQNAYIQFRADETTSGTTSFTLEGEAIDDAPTFTITDGNISSRNRTASSVAWSPPAWTKKDAGPDQQTSDIAAIIQDIVNRPGWSSGNALAIIISGTGERVAESIDGMPSAAPLLHVEFTTPGVTISQSAGSTDVTEGGAADNYTIALDSIPTSNVDVTVTPDSETDLGAGAGTAIMLTFTPANALTPQLVNVTAVDDTVAEGPHSSTITHSAVSSDPNYNGIAINNVVANITDNDTAVFTIDDVQVNEVDGTLDFTLALSNPLDIPVDVDVSFADVTTGAGDFNHTMQTISFAAFDNANKIVSVPITDDNIVELTETFTASLAINAGTPVGARSVDVTDTGTGTITDNDNAAVTVEDVSAGEGAGLQFTVTLDNEVQGNFDVVVSFTDVTATGGAAPMVSGEDYANDIVNLSFTGTAGEMRQFTVNTQADALLEGSETFSVNLSATHAAVVDTDTATGTIIDPNLPPVLSVPGAQNVAEDTVTSISGISVSDPDAGAADIQVTLSVTQATLSVNDFVAGGLASGDISGNGSSSVVLTGTVAEINTTLADPTGLTYLSNADYTGGDTLTVAADDMGNTGVGGPQTDQKNMAITVTEVNDVPVLTAGVVADLVVAEGSGTSSLALGGLMYGPGGGSDEAGQNLTYDVIAVPPSTLGDIVLSDGFTVVSTGTYSLTEIQGMQFRAATDAYGGPGTFTFKVTDDGTTGGGSDPQTLNQSLTITVTGPYVRTGIVTGVTNTGWKTVILDRPFTSMVVVLTANHDGAVPLVTRIRNANNDSDTFDVRVDRADGLTGAVAGVAVHYVVVEEGVYNLTDHGVTMEAVKFTSTVTDSTSSWVGESRVYSNAYSKPVVIGQVMTYNDASFSTFWSRGGKRNVAPSSTKFHVGKHVGEDPNTSRVPETIGYIVIKEGTGTTGSVEYVAKLGADSVRGVVESPPYNYTFSTIANPISAIATQAAMDGFNGSWAMLYGSNPLSSNSMNLAVDEDQMGDAERKHTTEQVAYIVFGATGTANAPPVLTVPAAQSVAEDAALVISGISVSDPDAGGADIQVTLSVNQGALNVNDTVPGGLLAGDITSNGSSSVVLTGTIAEINSTLADATGLTYQGNADYYGDDTLTVDANDLGNTGVGGPRTDQETVAITVNPTNDAPVNNIPGSQSVNEDTPLVFSTGNGNLISISDVDVGTANMLMILTSTNGTMTLNGTTGLSFMSGDGVDDTQMMFFGGIGDINAALDGLSFQPDPDFFGLATLDIETNDLGNTGGGQLIDVDSINIDVSAVNDAPVISVPTTQSTPVNTPLAFATDVNPISISDVDAGGALVEVTLTATNGLITLSNTNGLSFTVGDGTNDVTMTFTGTLADINSALDGLLFDPDLDFVGQGSLQISVNDLGNTGLGGALIDNETVDINVGP